MRRPWAGGLLVAIREIVLVVAVALVVSLVVKTFLLQAFFIPSASMNGRSTSATVSSSAS